MPLVRGPGQPVDAVGDHAEGRRSRLRLWRFLPSSCLLAPVGRSPFPTSMRTGPRSDEARAWCERGLMYLARGRKRDRERLQTKLASRLKFSESVGAQKDVERILVRKEG
jgi:hypothetical protein